MGRLPLYQCHKKVRAAKITSISKEHHGGAQLALDNGDRVGVSPAWVGRNPALLVGGYYVEYDDGYVSYSPSVAFESGYTLIGMD